MNGRELQPADERTEELRRLAESRGVEREHARRPMGDLAERVRDQRQRLGGTVDGVADLGYWTNQGCPDQVA